MTLLSKASLVATPTAYGDGILNSVKPTDGAGDFDFARASSATRVNEQGLIEKERENLLLDSNKFDTSNWANYQLTRMGGQSGYDGTTDAWLFTKTASGFANIRQAFTAISGVYTFSAYIKAGTNTSVIMRCLGTSDHQFAIDLSNGTSISTTNTIDTKIEDIGNGWYRCSIVFNANAVTNTYFYPEYPINGTTAGSIYVQDAQLEAGLVATDYIETTTSSVAVGITNDIPRINYENGIGNFLLEPQRTNLEPYSELLGTYSSAVIRLVNNTTSPEGLINANKFVESATTNRHEIYSDPIVFNGTTHIISFFAKADERRYMASFVGGNPAAGGAIFDLQTGTISQTSGGTTANVEDYGNGWYRFSFTATHPTTSQVYLCMRTTDTVVNVQTYTGDGTSGFYIWGLQVEVGSYATSYIPTYGSAVTRAAETCNNAGNSDLFNDSEGVLYAEIAALVNDSNTKRISLSDGTSSNRISLFLSDEIIGGIVVSGGGVTVNTSISGYDTTLNNKIVLKYKENDFSIFVNGFKVLTDTSGATPIGLNELRFDNGYSGNEFYGKTKMVSTFTEALSDSELECLTSWSSFERMATAQNYTIQ